MDDDHIIDPTHLGDGSYASLDRYGTLVITADHHDPEQASNRVYIDGLAVSWLASFLLSHFPQAFPDKPIQFDLTVHGHALEVRVRRDERQRCIAIARGCHDYSGGHSGDKLEAFLHGIDTVVNVLSAPDGDMQAKVVEAIAAASDPLPSPATATAPPTLSALLDVLSELDDEVLHGVYDLDPESRADLDAAVYAWRAAGCPR